VAVARLAGAIGSLSIWQSTRIRPWTGPWANILSNKDLIFSDGGGIMA
jgi:hypothetical protein